MCPCRLIRTSRRVFHTPTRDPAGHSFAHPVPQPAAFDDRRWFDSREYLLGCDLFNYGYYWEAHESWEAAWQACGRHGPPADFLKGLIKLAAAGVKAREGRPRGVARHAARAGELFRGVRGSGPSQVYLGLDVDWLIALSATLATHMRPSQGHVQVEILFDFQLLPKTDEMPGG